MPHKINNHRAPTIVRLIATKTNGLGLQFDVLNKTYS